MDTISIFDIFKIGVGPSSSHTLGPWKAAMRFASGLKNLEIDEVQVRLYGSLSKTGIGHATDIAVLLGLMRYDPKKIITADIADIVQGVKEKKQLSFGHASVQFLFDKDIILENSIHPLHPNTVKFTAYSSGSIVLQEVYASVGGGFIEMENEVVSSDTGVKLPYPIDSGADLLGHARHNLCNISDIVWRNELAMRSQDEINAQINEILETFWLCIYEGCNTSGILPGGLNVERRASAISKRLLGAQSLANQKEWFEALKKVPKDFNSVNIWVSCFALAVNEQNAAMGRVVTSPTNGSAGVIPAVLMYYRLFCNYRGEAYLHRFLYTAGEVGSLFKKGTTISAAVGGCQAEIGVSSAMAAAGLTEVLGGTPSQCLMAAEIAMEHHLGLTCDPVNGLVQIPCIERNAMGAFKAITASNLALEGNPDVAKVSIDAVIKTMWETAQDMHTKYKETSEGGLAINLPVIHPSC